MTERTVDLIVQQNLKRLRDGLEVSQEELAARVRALCGLAWTQSTVAQIETGRRAISLGELVLLGNAFEIGFPELLRELLAADDEFVRVEQTLGTYGDVRIDGWSWGELVDGRPVNQFKEAHPLLLLLPERERRRKRVVERARRYGVSESQIADAYDASFHDAERRAARRLDRDAVVVAFAAFGQWGEGLTARRDRELALGDQGGDARARRGHVTRRLVEELRSAINAAERRRRP